MTSSNTRIPPNSLIVIPARYRSTRLPGKPLATIRGVPMIVRTVWQCWEVAAKSQVLVATDDQRIADVCDHHGIRFEMTSPDHPTGSDRVAEVAARVPASLYINVQGDEPVFNPSDILKIVSASLQDRDKTHIGYCDLKPSEWGDSKHIKLTFGLNNQLIYIGRANVPGSHDGSFQFGYRQVCVYVYSKGALEQFASTKGRTPLEKIEDNEVMRFLELGLPVKVVKLSDQSISVDRPEDVLSVEARLLRTGEESPDASHKDQTCIDSEKDGSGE